MASATTEELEQYNVWVGCLACYNNGRLVGEWAAGAEAPLTDAAFIELVGRRALTASGHFKDSVPHEELWVFDDENGPDAGEYGVQAARDYAATLASK